MWVIYSDEIFPSRVGILTKLDANDIATVMLTDEEGMNLLEVQAPARILRQATIKEIPSARLTPVYFNPELGYTK